LPEARDALQIAIENNGYRWQSQARLPVRPCIKIATYGPRLRAGERLPSDVSDPQPRDLVRPPAGLHGPRRRVREPRRAPGRLASSVVKPCASMIVSVHPSGEPASSLSARFCSTPRQTFRGLTAAIARRSPAPGCSRQFGRASAPTMPQRVHTMRGRNVGTGTSSDHGSALMIARW
jgi:hypothetical protein